MSTKKMWLNILLLICFATATPKIIAQESRPSLSETIEWFENHIGNSVVADSQILPKKLSKQRTAEWKFESPSKCMLTWKGSLFDEKNAAIPVAAKINLTDFDPQRTSLGSFTQLSPSLNRAKTTWTISIITTDKKNLVEWQNHNKTFYSNLISFRFEDEDLADGVVRAFENAITLCDGKSKPDKPDPFIKKKPKDRFRL